MEVGVKTRDPNKRVAAIRAPRRRDSVRHAFDVQLLGSTEAHSGQKAASIYGVLRTASPSSRREALFDRGLLDNVLHHA